MTLTASGADGASATRCVTQLNGYRIPACPLERVGFG